VPTPSRRCRLRCSASRRLSACRRVRPPHLPERGFRSHRRPIRAARVRARPENWIAVPVLKCPGELCGSPSRAPERVEPQLSAFRSRDRALRPVRALTGSRFAACREPYDPSRRLPRHFDSERCGR